MTHAMEPTGFSSERAGTSAAWRWRMLDASGAEVPQEALAEGPAARDPGFASQGDAETWIGEAWRDLVEAGVDAVTLLEGDREVYGPMSLHP
jgi:hypothetical protein